MLGSVRSRDYCLEMICADFLAGAHLDDGDSGDAAVLDVKIFKFLPGEQRQEFALKNCDREPGAD